MNPKVQREIYILRAAVVLNTALLCLLWFAGFKQNNDKQKFGEIDVERLNIIDADGKYQFVLTNGMRAPGAIIGGKEYHRANSNNVPAILFYNGEGDESGALYSVGKIKDDGTYYGSSRLVFDRFRRDETLAFQYYEDQLGGYAGMLVQDTRDMPADEWLEGNAVIRAMPDGPEKTEALKKFRESAGPWATKRMFIGKRNNSKAAVIDLADRKGNTRLSLSVDSLGAPRLDFLNEAGEITYSLPDAKNHQKE